MSIRIVTDSGSDLPPKLADKFGITVVPLTVRFGNEQFVDREQLTIPDFWRRCKASSQLPQTAAPPPAFFEKAYKALAAAGATGVVVVTLSSALSATNQAANLAARAVGASIDVKVVDSRLISMGLGLVAIGAAQKAMTGASLDDVVRTAEDLRNRTKMLAALDTLENLRKGGRIGKAAAVFGSLLSVKPIIEIRDGVVEPESKQRTRSKALAHLVEVVRNAGPLERMAVLHAQADDIDDFVNSLRQIYKGEILVGDIGPVIGTHAGIGATGLTYQMVR